ncbi:MAG: hypothetical protein AAF399_02385, partial [Bacteroidota bacterium]
EDVLSDLRFKIEAEFRRNDIHIPYPQRDLHIRSDFRAEKTAVLAPIEKEDEKENKSESGKD